MNLADKFAAWVASDDGALVLDELERRALALVDRGWRHFGIGCLWEQLRYDRALRVGPDADGWKLNNDHRSRVARLLMDRQPRLAGFFDLRELKTGFEPVRVDPPPQRPRCLACAGRVVVHAAGCPFGDGDQGRLAFQDQTA